MYILNVLICETHISSLLTADVGWIEKLDGQALLLHVKAPQPLIFLIPTHTLTTQVTPDTQRHNVQLFKIKNSEYEVVFK